jgi:hypothetical protein
MKWREILIAGGLVLMLASTGAQSIGITAGVETGHAKYADSAGTAIVGIDTFAVADTAKALRANALTLDAIPNALITSAKLAYPMNSATDSIRFDPSMHLQFWAGAKYHNIWTQEFNRSSIAIQAGHDIGNHTALFLGSDNVDIPRTLSMINIGSPDGTDTLTDQVGTQYNLRYATQSFATTLTPLDALIGLNGGHYIWLSAGTGLADPDSFYGWWFFGTPNAVTRQTYAFRADVGKFYVGHDSTSFIVDSRHSFFNHGLTVTGTLSGRATDAVKADSAGKVATDFKPTTAVLADTSIAVRGDHVGTADTADYALNFAVPVGSIDSTDIDTLGIALYNLPEIPEAQMDTAFLNAIFTPQDTLHALHEWTPLKAPYATEAAYLTDDSVGISGFAYEAATVSYMGVTWGMLAQDARDSCVVPPDSVGVSGWSTTSGLATHATEADHSDSTEIALTAYLAYTADALTNGLEWSLFTQTLLDSIFAHQPAFPDSVGLSGHADTADTCTYATNALSAGSATSADEADSAGVAEYSYQMEFAGYDSIPGGQSSVLVSTPGVLANPNYANTQIIITPCNVFAKGILTYDSLYTGGFRVTDRTPLGASIAGRAHFSWAIVRHQAGGM